jgi:4-amino-4-deoxy-L-arabinose transferase-like glycosyltransferase
LKTRQALRSSVWGWLAFLTPLALYAASVSPWVAYWDTGEMQTVPYILGIAHPTGFPAFVLAGWLFTHLVPFGTVAWRVGLLCAIAMAGAARLVFSLAELLGAEAPVALGSALMFAVGSVAWTRGTRAEVHAFVAFFAALALVSAVRWYRTGERRSLLWLGAALGLGLATHLVIALLVPGIALIVLARARELNARVLAAPIAIAVASLALYLYLPLRSADVSARKLDPTLALGIPPGRPYWDYGHPASLAGLKRDLAGSDFDVGHGVSGIVSLAGYGRIVERYLGAARHEFGAVVLIAALLGLVFAARDAPLAAAGLVLAVATPVPFALSYQAESDVDRYFLASFVAVAALAGAGMSRAVVSYLLERSRFATVVATAMMAIFVAQIFWTNRYIFGQRNDDEAKRFADRVIASTPNDAIVIANWAYATPLAYAAYVERRTGNRIVETAWVGDDLPYLARWTRERPVYAVVVGTSPNLPGVRFVEADLGYPSLLRVVR